MEHDNSVANLDRMLQCYHLFSLAALALMSLENHLDTQVINSNELLDAQRQLRIVVDAAHRNKFLTDDQMRVVNKQNLNSD